MGILWLREEKDAMESWFHEKPSTLGLEKFCSSLKNLTLTFNEKDLLVHGGCEE